jgi:nucleoid-associated protein YgaU
MVAKPVTVGVVGVVVLASALVLNYFVLPGEEAEIATPAIRPSVPATAPPKASTAAPKTATSTVPSQPSTTAAPATRQELPSAPSFDIVRVDPEGNAVIAGRGAPNSEIAIIDGEDEIGRVVTDDRGEWVFVPPAKLSPGERVLMLRGLDSKGKESTEAVVLVIPERGKDIAGRPSAEPSVPLAVVVPRDTGAAGGTAVARVLQAPSAGPIEPVAPSKSAAPTKPSARAEGAAGTETSNAPKSSSQDTTAAAAKPVDKVPGSTLAGGALTRGSAGASVAATAPVASDTSTTGSASPEPTRTASAEPIVSAYPEPAPQDKPAEGTKSGDVAVDVIDYDDKGEVVFSGRSEPGARVEVFIDNRKVGDTAANAEGRWKMQPADPVPPGSYQLRVDKVAPTGTVVARVAFPFVRANPLTELPKGRLVVIQPGNNLWRIATRVYGSGVRYVEIFDANQDQILNPDLIFPGQVFGLPRVN